MRKLIILAAAAIMASPAMAKAKKEFWSNVYVPGKADDLNTELEKALRLSDFIDTGYLIAIDALNREESCGGHFREEYQTQDGEALRRDDLYSYVSCWTTRLTSTVETRTSWLPKTPTEMYTSYLLVPYSSHQIVNYRIFHVLLIIM